MHNSATPVLCDTIPAVRQRRAAAGARGARIGLVPTMGALHAGHVTLIERARAECDEVVVSIFVNRPQFDRADDLARYPRTRAADLDVCRRCGVDIVFAPADREMYPEPMVCTVALDGIDAHLCGAYRPGHFRAVATVVLKLLQIVQPDRAYFGEKDAQQTAIIRRLVADLNVPVTIVGVPTVREADGVAVSSRNARLTPPERELAPALYRALREAEQSIEGGERDPTVVRQRAASRVPGLPALRLEYLEIVSPETMQPVDTIDGPVRVAGALWVGETRLIDNVLCTPPRGGQSPHGTETFTA